MSADWFRRGAKAKVDGIAFVMLVEFAKATDMPAEDAMTFFSGYFAEVK